MKKFLYHKTPQSTISLVLNVADNWGNIKEKVLNEINISSIEFSILASITGITIRKQKTTLIEISLYSKIDLTGLQNAISSLLEKKHISVLKNNDIEENNEFLKTNSGHEILQKGLTIVNKAEDQFFAKLNAEELVLFRNMLKRINPLIKS